MECQYCKDEYNWQKAIPVTQIPRVYQFRLFGNGTEITNEKIMVHERRWFSCTFNYAECMGRRTA